VSTCNELVEHKRLTTQRLAVLEHKAMELLIRIDDELIDFDMLCPVQGADPEVKFTINTDSCADILAEIFDVTNEYTNLVYYDNRDVTE